MMIIAGSLAAVCLLLSTAVRADALLQTVADLPLPGHATRFDYQSFDRATNRLYISHMGDGTLLVVDTRGRRVVAELHGFPVVTGVRVVPELHRLFASVTHTHEVIAVDTEALKIVAHIPDGDFPDGLAYAPEVRKVYVSDESGGHETVIDALANRVVHTIDLGGEIGNTQYDGVSRHIFANVQTRNDLVEIDPATDSIVARHALAGGKSPHGLHIVAPARLAFAACEGDAKLLVIDMETWKVTQVLDTGGEPDVLAFDDALGVLYVATESEIVSVFHLEGKSLEKRGDARVGRDAHSVAVDPATHEVYFPLKNVDGRPLLRIMKPPG
jgi:DNA-binding beta-propeller fold protein YncE